MRFDPQAGVLPGDSRVSRRRAGRLPLERLFSNLGEVLDLSAGGMRVVCAGLPPGRICIKLGEYPLPEPLIGVVTWTKRMGLFKKQVGIRFENLSPMMAQCLTIIASNHRFRRAV